MWEEVEEIFNEAAECEEYGQDENAWCTGVIQAILKRGVKSSPLLQLKSVYISLELFRAVQYLVT